MKSNTKILPVLLSSRIAARPPPHAPSPLTPPQLGQSSFQRLPMLPLNSTRSMSLDSPQCWNPPSTPSHSHSFRPVHPSVTPMSTHVANPSQPLPPAFRIPIAPVHPSIMLQPSSTPNSSQYSHPSPIHVHREQSISEQSFLGLRFASPARSVYVQRQRAGESENHMPSQPSSQGTNSY